jgi:hypothetical protein
LVAALSLAMTAGRGIARGHKGGPGAAGDRREPDFGHGRDVGQFGRAFWAHYCEGTQFAVLDQLKGGTHRIEGHLDFPGYDGHQGRATTFVWDMQDICAADRLEQLGIQVRQCADPAGSSS